MDRRDAAGMTAHLASDIQWQEATGSPVGGIRAGIGRVRDEVFAILAAQFPDWTVAIDELIVQGDTVIGLGSFAATSRKTGRAVVTRVAQVWRVRDGKAVRFEHILDTDVLVDSMTVRAPSAGSSAQCTELHTPCADDQ
jgi:ketosteroid isomerase-like protein